MARIKESVTVIDRVPHLKLTKGRSAALVQACSIALESGYLEKRQKGTIGSLRELFEETASGHFVVPDPCCFVYVHYRDSQMDVCKIGHTRDLKKRLSRNTDMTEPLKRAAAWEAVSVQEATKQEDTARSLFDPFGDGGTEWVNAPAREVVARLVEMWGPPIRE
ncbi:GIY-YIG nuclease family protein [Falsihalocynthiibacter sp. BN13B15]|uniref:GIY-YIG nuclease family protein n=1 Tax=Falsihalocynthiibacter sp. BN13B15 TaxID=3240871 RepID=UPI00351006CC